MHKLYYVEFVYNLQNEEPKLDENHDKLNRFGFKILMPPKEDELETFNDRDYDNKKDYWTKAKGFFPKADTYNMKYQWVYPDKVSKITQNGFLMDNQEFEDQDKKIFNSFGYRIWVRYDTRVHSEYKDVCKS